ncbi:hypothetical protein IQ62_27455 [Streptomyces scabiei]|nr:hypothetical protein IQ62_27455 [Streptomyces scabiei]
MVLMNGSWDLPFPDPAPAELVAIPALIHQYVTGMKCQRLSLLCWNSDQRDLIEVQPSTLNVGDSKIGDFR